MMSMGAITVNKRGRPRNGGERLEQRRLEILDAAALIFARRGYAGTEIEVVARASGLAKGTIYLYFPSKEALFLAAVDRGMRRLVAVIDAAIADIPDPLGQLETAIRAYLKFFRDYPQYVELLIQERAVFRDRKKPTYQEHKEANAGRWRALYRGLIAAGRIRRLSVARIMDVIGNLVYGTMFTEHFLGRRQSPAAQAAAILDIILNGILTPAERRRTQQAPAR
jgi:AcrR family transcriptional regulator